MQRNLTVAPRLALVLAVGVTAAGCEGIFGAREGAPVSLSFTAPRAAPALAVGVSASLIPVSGGGHTVDVQQVQVEFSEVVLERAEGAFGGDSDGDSEADSDSDGQENERFRRDGVTVDLPLGGGVVTPITTTLPVGLYEEIEMDVARVRLRGTYDGQSFDVSLPVNAELEMEFNPPFEVDSDDDRLNLTVSIDALGWFRNADGSVVDPRALATNGDLRARFVNRIRASFKAFEDSDRDADDADSDSDSDSR